MKRLHHFLTIGSIAALSLLTYSCVDESYDLEKADYKVQLLSDGINLPIGTFEIGMDSILKVDENSTSGLRIKDNMYFISITTPMDISGLNNTISNLNLATPSGFSQDVAVATGGVGVGNPFPVNTYTYSSNISSTLPNFNTPNIEVKRVNLTSTTFTMTNTTHDLGGNNLNGSITIKCTPQDNVATYYVNGVEVTDSWTMPANSSKTIEIKQLDLTSSQTINIKCEATINVQTLGDVTVTGSNPRVHVGVLFNNIDFTTAYGKITYSLSDTIVNKFDGFGDMLGGGQNTLSIYNPTIKFKWSENLGVPVDVSLDMSASNTSTGQIASLTNTSFTMEAASSPSAMVVDSILIDRFNGTSNLLKINPTSISTKYSIQTDNTSSNSFIAKNTQLELESTLEVPVQFNDDLMLTVADTIDNPFLKVLEKLDEQENLGFAINFDVTNRIPLGIKIKLIAVNEAGDSLFAQETDTIAPGSGLDDNGFATQATQTLTSLTLSSENIDQIKDVATFRLGFIITAEQSTIGFVTISPSDYIRMNISATITGGMILDLNKEEE